MHARETVQEIWFRHVLDDLELKLFFTGQPWWPTCLMLHLSRDLSPHLCGYWKWNVWNHSRKPEKSTQWKKDIKIKKFRAVCKNYWETQRKSNNKFVWDKNLVLAVDKIANVLLQSKKKQICLGLTPKRFVLVLGYYIYFAYPALLTVWLSVSRISYLYLSVLRYCMIATSYW